MKNLGTLALAVLFLISGNLFSQTKASREKDASRTLKADTRIDNNGYWRFMAEKGLARLNGVQPVPPAVFTGSEIKAFSSITEDSPDVPVAPSNTTQSENSIFVAPNDNQLVINSNNSSENPLGNFYGADATKTVDGGLTWGGTVQGAGGYNSGDPVALIGLDGAYYIGFIDASYGQSVAKSTNGGLNYTVHTVAGAGGGILDKNHLWIDNCPTSPYEGNLYDAWTDFTGGSFDSEIAFSRSTNGSTNWSSTIEVSSEVNAGSHNQGVNINSGPNGEVYVIWAIYDGWPTDESAIGMARSFDGGATFDAGRRVIQNIRGIRTTGVGKNMRNNSFPSMAVDISGGEYNGNIYVVWANVGVPGINSGNDVDVYLIRSEDQGTTWSTPVKVNQDASGLGHVHYLPWITCDPESGNLSVVFYDDRNVGGQQCEVYSANSFDAGETWEDFKVSDVAFTPTPIPGLADGYMGDYIGINARGGWVYPIWADTRTGSVMTYCSPYQTNPLERPKNLTAAVTFETGITDLQWTYQEIPGFTYFNIYRDGELIGTATDTVYADQLPTYGVYSYKVTAYYEGVGESNSANASVQWGDAQISVTPAEIEESLQPDSSVTRYVTVNNIGQLPMNYNLSLFVPGAARDGGNRAYCDGSGYTCDEYISRVQLNEIDNPTICTNYGDYTSIATNMSVGDSYEIIITNGNPIWALDECGVWVDWNQNEVFDENESIPVNGNPGVGPYTATITPPIGTMPGLTRLRTRITYNETPNPCGVSSYGEVEDYSVYVMSWVLVDPTSGNVPAGESMQIAVTLSAVDLAIGTYTAELQIFSNDPDDPEIIVPITLNVADLAVNVTADQHSICQGEPVQLSSTVVGGSQNLTYTWSSDPAGFESSEPNPLVYPTETTTYMLSISNGTLTASDQVTVIVNPLPVVNLGADATICDGDSVIVAAGDGFASYLWSTGETTPSITAKTTGDYWVVVANEFNCMAQDTMTVTVNLYPGKPSITNGPATVDNFVSSSSTYTCSEATDAISYQWSVTPAGAGSTTSTGTSANVTWTSGYTGDVQVTVIAVNGCGNGELSDAFSTMIYSSQGVPENSASKMVIYPNPGKGLFSVKLPVAAGSKADLKVTDATGAAVYQQSALNVPPGGQIDINLSDLPDGVYSLKVTVKESVYQGKLILQHK